MIEVVYVQESTNITYIDYIAILFTGAFFGAGIALGAVMWL